MLEAQLNPNAPTLTPGAMRATQAMVSLFPLAKNNHIYACNGRKLTDRSKAEG
jgi:hypothetical protein